MTALTAAKWIGPRLGRWDIKGDPPMGSPGNTVIGLFMLWWGWLAFNAGSTFGISQRYTDEISGNNITKPHHLIPLKINFFSNPENGFWLPNLLLLQWCLHLRVVYLLHSILCMKQMEKLIF